MFSLVESDYLQIAQRYFGRDDVCVLRHGSNETNCPRGFLTVPTTMWIEVNVAGTIKTLKFFIKSPPNTNYQLDLVRKCGLLLKEIRFYDTLSGHLEKYFTHKVVPKSYLPDSEIMVFEDLALGGYSNTDLGTPFNVDQCKAALKSLASLHSASFLYENEINSTIDTVFSEILYISWFSLNPEHPVRHHIRTAVKAFEFMANKYFGVSEDVMQKALRILEQVPHQILPSKTHKNSLTHGDVWGNNMMFKYQNGKVDNCCLIDLQLFAYNPPVCDVLTLLFLHATDNFIPTHMSDLLKYYYQCFRDNLTHFGLNPDNIITQTDFENAKDDYVSFGLGCSFLFNNLILLPKPVQADLLVDGKKLGHYMEVDKIELMNRSIEMCSTYKYRILATIKNILDFAKGDLKV